MKANSLSLNAIIVPEPAITGGSMTPLQMVNRIGLLEIISTFVAAAIARLVYFAFLHPLSIYPGPPLAAQTYLWYAAVCFILLLCQPAPLCLLTMSVD